MSALGERTGHDRRLEHDFLLDSWRGRLSEAEKKKWNIFAGECLRAKANELTEDEARSDPDQWSLDTQKLQAMYCLRAFQHFGEAGGTKVASGLTQKSLSFFSGGVIEGTQRSGRRFQQAKVVLRRTTICPVPSVATKHSSKLSSDSSKTFGRSTQTISDTDTLTPTTAKKSGVTSIGYSSRRSASASRTVHLVSDGCSPTALNGTFLNMAVQSIHCLILV